MDNLIVPRRDCRAVWSPWRGLHVCFWWLGCSCTKIQVLLCCGDHLISLISATPHLATECLFPPSSGRSSVFQP